MRRQRGGIEMLLIYGVAALALVAVTWGAWAAFTGSYVERGRAEVRARYAPIVAECDKRRLAPAQCVDAWLAAERDLATVKTNLTTCQTTSREQSDAIAAAAESVAKARAATRQILAEIAKQSDATRAEVDRLRAIAATPAASRKEACDEADAVLAALAARRLRFAPGPTGARGQGGDGQDSDPGVVRIRP